MAALIDPALAGDVSALATALNDRTDGNPFFVQEVLRHLEETATVGVATDGAARTAEALTALPPGVRDLIARRVARLGATTNEALSRGAVIGRSFRLSRLQRSWAGDRMVLLDGRGEAVRAGLIVPARGEARAYRFVHAHVRGTLYDELRPGHRRGGGLSEATALREGDVPSLPFPDERFDVVLSCTVAEEWHAAPAAALRDGTLSAAMPVHCAVGRRP